MQLPGVPTDTISSQSVYWLRLNYIVKTRLPTDQIPMTEPKDLCKHPAAFIIGRSQTRLVAQLRKCGANYPLAH